MEAAVCGVKAIALSYAFFDRNHDAGIISGASDLSAKLVQYLWDNWDDKTHLYTVNVPLVENVGDRKILWTHMLQNTWRNGSCFQVLEVPSEADDSPSDIEAQIRKQEERLGKKELRSNSEVLKGGCVSGTDSGRDTPTGQGHVRYTHKHFKWAPQFKDVYQSVEESEPGNDGWAVAQGFTSVTALRANFMHVQGFEGEIKLGGSKSGDASSSGKPEELPDLSM